MHFCLRGRPDLGDNVRAGKQLLSVLHHFNTGCPVVIIGVAGKQARIGLDHTLMPDLLQSGGRCRRHCDSGFSVKHLFGTANDHSIPFLLTIVVSRPSGYGQTGG